jgi:hypothetical protein
VGGTVASQPRLHIDWEVQDVREPLDAVLVDFVKHLHRWQA